MSDNATVPPEPLAGRAADRTATDLWRLLAADAAPLEGGHAASAAPPWPRALRATVELMLPSKAQMVLFWGPDFTSFYNDAYAPFIGGLHPRAFGRSSREDWSDLWDDLVPLLERVYKGGETVAVSDRAFQVERNGAVQEVFFDISFSPVRDEEGAIGGVLCLVSETTAKVQALRALAASESRQQAADRQLAMALGAGAAIGTWVWDIAADRLTGDERFAQTFGLDAAKLRLGVPMEQMLAQIHPGDRAAVWQGLKQALGSCGAYRVEYRVRVHGSWRWMESSGHVECNPGGEPLRLPGVLVDVDARRQAQGELQLVHEQLRVTQNDSNVGLFVQDLANGQITVSPEFCLLYGLPVTAAVSASAIDAMATAAETHWQHRTRQLGAGEDEGKAEAATLDVEYRIRRADTGALRWVARRARFLCDADGRPVQRYGVVQDVTDKKDTEAALLASKASFGTLARSVPIQIWTATTDGKIDWCNQYVLDYAGTDRAQLADGGWMQLVHPGDLARLQGWLPEVARVGTARGRFLHLAKCCAHLPAHDPGRTLQVLILECANQILQGVCFGTVVLERAARTRGNVPEILYNLGIAYSELGQYESAIMRLKQPSVRQGSITWHGEELVALPSYEVARRRIALVPQGRRLFPSLTVLEHLTMTKPMHSTQGWTVERIFEVFPRLAERRHHRGGQLSGGERQMLAIGRALVIDPVLMLLDEPSEGLAPVMVQQLEGTIAKLKAAGLGILLVEQNFYSAMAVADRVYIMETGKVVHEAPASQVLEEQESLMRYLSVH